MKIESQTGKTWTLKQFKHKCTWLVSNYTGLDRAVKLQWASQLVLHINNDDLNLNSMDDLDFITDILGRLERGASFNNMLATNIWDIILDYGANVYNLEQCKIKLMNEIDRLKKEDTN